MWIWLVVAVLAAIGEVLSFDLFLAAVAVAAIVTAILALVLPFVLQVGSFGALSLVGIAFVRPVIKRALGITSLAQDAGAFTHSRLVGRRGIITQAVDAGGGQIRIGEGEFWTARPFDPAETLAPGEAAEVLLIDGLTAVVERVAPPALTSTIGAVSTTALAEKGIAS